VRLLVAGREAYAYTGGKDFDPALPCIVFLHGALNDHSVWTLLARWCANHGHAVLAVDLPGHMRSAGPALTDIEAMADWTLALLDAAGVQQAALAGHSMGSLIALEAAGRAPDRVTRLVMLGSCYPMAVPKALLDLSLADPLKAIDRVVMFSHSTLAPKPSFPGPGVWLRGAATQLSRQVLRHQGDPGLFHNDFAACDRYDRGLEAAARVHCPAHLILGRDDQMTPTRATRDIVGALKAEVRYVQAGHNLMQEAPESVLAALRSALPGGAAP
jgi:pimeloyl-ACP methyl ester carboxylesterase